MKKNLLCGALCLALLTPLYANATEDSTITAKDYSLKANIKRIALEYMQHSVSNKNDPNYPDSYNSDEKSNIGGTFYGNITYEKNN